MRGVLGPERRPYRIRTQVRTAPRARRGRTNLDFVANVSRDRIEVTRPARCPPPQSVRRYSGAINHSRDRVGVDRRCSSRPNACQRRRRTGQLLAVLVPAILANVIE